MATGESDKDSGLGGALYEGGVFSSETYGGGAEDYDITGMRSHRGKGPRNYTRADDRIHDEICERLTRHPLIDASLLEVQVEKGNVTLKGEVSDRRMKYLAEEVVDDIYGVKEIHNSLRVMRDRAA
jgi:osmotically-inducible protein OsmY